VVVSKINERECRIHGGHGVGQSAFGAAARLTADFETASDASGAGLRPVFMVPLSLRAEISFRIEADIL
jgi:hypothetical protein